MLRSLVCLNKTSLHCASVYVYQSSLVWHALMHCVCFLKYLFTVIVKSEKLTNQSRFELRVLADMAVLSNYIVCACALS